MRTQLQEEKFPSMVSSQQLRNYSVICDADGAWSRLESLKVFRPASRVPTLDLVDVTTTAPEQVQQRTFTDATELEAYIEQESVLGGTRYM